MGREVRIPRLSAGAGAVIKELLGWFPVAASVGLCATPVPLEFHTWRPRERLPGMAVTGSS